MDECDIRSTGAIVIRSVTRELFNNFHSVRILSVLKKNNLLFKGKRFKQNLEKFSTYREKVKCMKIFNRAACEVYLTWETYIYIYIYK